MKKKIIIRVSFILIAGLINAQIPSLGKAKSLMGKNNSGSSTNGNSSGSTTPTNNTSTTTNNNTLANTTPTTTAAENKTGKATAKDAPVAIVFSNSSGQKSSNYFDGDAIYARVDFALAMKDIGGKKYNDVFIINLFDGTKFLNGKKLGFLKDEDMNNAFLEFQVACSIDQAKSPLAEAFTKTMAEQLGKGKHSITVKLIRVSKFNEELAVAEGTFDLDLSSGKDKLRGQADSYDAKEIAARRMPTAAMQNAAIEKDLKNLISHDVNEAITPLRAVVAESDWEILRDDYTNVITGRIIAGYVAFKVTRNGRCFYKKITIYQPYTGAGKYGVSKYYDTRVSSDILEMDCGNVMK
jgi:hypothetical protein